MWWIFVTWQSGDDGEPSPLGTLYGPIPKRVAESLYEFLVHSAHGVDQVWTFDEFASHQAHPAMRRR